MRPHAKLHSTGDQLLSYFLLFLGAFAAATILPFYSEVALVTMLHQQKSVFWIWAVATAGNTLGAVLNWSLGRYLMHFQQRRWFPFKTEKLQRTQGWFRRYGKWSLLLAWLPVGGDALTFIAGVMRTPLLWMVVLTAIGKGARYAVVILLYFFATG